MNTATASIATLETDAACREQMRQQGSIARGAGKDRTDCPHNGLCAHWWLEGYDSAPDMMKAFAPGVPLGG